MAERDSTKTPVAAEALIAAAAPLALHRIPRGRPAPASGCARAPRPRPSRRPAQRAHRAAPSAAPPRRARPQPPGKQGRCTGPRGPLPSSRPGLLGLHRERRAAPRSGNSPLPGDRCPQRRALCGKAADREVGAGPRPWAQPGACHRRERLWRVSGPNCGQAEGGARPRGCQSGKSPRDHPRGEPSGRG